MHNPIPVTIVTSPVGFAVAPLVSRLRTETSDLRVTSIVPRKGGKRGRERSIKGVVQTQERLVKLGEGCSCCTVRGDLLTHVREISQSGEADHIVIQTAPMSDLEVLSKTFTVADRDGSVLGETAQLQNMVVVLEATSLLETLLGTKSRAIVEKVQFANVLVLDKAGDVKPEGLTHLVNVLEALNPEAHVVRSDHAEFASQALVGGRTFDLNDVRRRSRLRGSEEVASEGTGIVKFTFFAREPFHPERLHKLLQETWQGVVRVGGSFWVATCPEYTCYMDFAGQDRQTHVEGRWWATVPEEQRPDNPALKEYLESIWEPPYGDRHQRITILGVGVDESQLRARLQDCLLRQEEIEEPEQWSSYPHPFAWPGNLY